MPFLHNFVHLKINTNPNRREEEPESRLSMSELRTEWWVELLRLPRMRLSFYDPLHKWWVVKVRRKRTGIHYHWANVFPMITVRAIQRIWRPNLFGLVSNGLKALMIDWSNSKHSIKCSFNKIKMRGYYPVQHFVRRGWVEDPLSVISPTLSKRRQLTERWRLVIVLWLDQMIQI